MIRALRVGLYVLAGVFVGCEIGLYGGFGAGAGGGLLVFLFCLQADNAIAGRRAREEAEDEIAKLKRNNFLMEKTLAETRRRMDDLTATFEAKSSAEKRKIVSELQILERLMREFSGRMPHRPGAQDLPAPVPSRTASAAVSGEPDLLETVRAALEENRVDLYLQPTVSLPQRKLRYYEALSRLRSADGRLIMPAQYIRIAAPAGLMSVVDNLLLFRCVQIVRRLTAKNREVGVFCNISGTTLTDAEFFPQFLEYLEQNRDLAGRIVFEFTQKALAGAGAAGEANLGYLSRLGFVLSLDHIESLAVDFAHLRDLGFRHLKVAARTLTGGMDKAGAAVAAEDIKALLSRYGLNLIAERVEDEKTVIQLLDYGVDFAQGYLFGEPRAVRGEAMRPAGPAAAPPLRRAG
jgi:cyclic-di-GMP phosphodiesterase TipF (flagellum assembly factor)